MISDHLFLQIHICRSFRIFIYMHTGHRVHVFVFTIVAVQNQRKTNEQKIVQLISFCFTSITKFVSMKWKLSVRIDDVNIFVRSSLVVSIAIDNIYIKYFIQTFFYALAAHAICQFFIFTFVIISSTMHHVTWESCFQISNLQGYIPHIICLFLNKHIVFNNHRFNRQKKKKKNYYFFMVHIFLLSFSCF